MSLQALDPWLAHRSRDNEPTLIVLHATAGATARSSIDTIRGNGLSYHYIIARDGKDSPNPDRSDGSEPIIFHCVPDEGHAFHVGSTVPTASGHGINRSSIGLSLANIQRRSSPEPYMAKQFSALDALLSELKARHPSIRWLTTHAVVQPWNRSDPQGLDGPAIARLHGFEWWAPDAALLARHKPQPARRLVG